MTSGEKVDLERHSVKQKEKRTRGYKKFELKRQECDYGQRKTFDCNVDKDMRVVKWSERNEQSPKLHEHNLNFDIKSYIISHQHSYK